MRIAALYDIHGNLPALEAVLADVRRAGVDRIVVGGDVVPGPMVRQALDCLLAIETPVEFIRGNGESAVLDELAGRGPEALPEQAREAVRWAAEQLRSSDRHMLAAWPGTCRIAISGLGDVLFCHATPRSETEIFTRFTTEDRLLPVFRGIGVPLVLCGHTHMQFDRTIHGVRIVNAGSVGMPFGEPGAYWCLLGPDVQLCRTAYNLEHAADRVRLSAYPGADHFAQRHILSPPAEAEMLEVFAKAELR
jgi:predicted phosphodiesterase